MDKILELYEREKFNLEQFMKRLVNFFQDHPLLNNTDCNSLPAIYSVRCRMKDNSHLKEKLKRKQSEGREITIENFFDEITDLIGIRVLYYYIDQTKTIHDVIMEQVEKEELVLFETPKAYTWDIDAKNYFQKLGLNTQIKPSYYTSIHYVVMPKHKSPIKCEIQVRTLFEEAWGEIDHALNYPAPSTSIACREQLKVLAQISAAGTKLASSIVRSQAEYSETDSN